MHLKHVFCSSCRKTTI